MGLKTQQFEVMMVYTSGFSSTCVIRQTERKRTRGRKVQKVFLTKWLLIKSESCWQSYQTQF